MMTVDEETANRVEHLADQALPVPDIAERLGVPEETVKVVLYGEGDGA